jgi:prepilin-type N-terminal cleavage/methylation domain-containing protein
MHVHDQLTPRLGMTLLEVLATIVILALVAVYVIPSFNRMQGSDARENAMVVVRDALVFARSASLGVGGIMDLSPQRILCTTNNGTRQEFAFTESVMMNWHTPSSQQHRNRLLFDQHGRSEDIVITVRYRNQDSEWLMSGLSGALREVPPPNSRSVNSP